MGLKIPGNDVPDCKSGTTGKSLVEKELVIEHKGKYSIYDRFLALYFTVDQNQ